MQAKIGYMKPESLVPVHYFLLCSTYLVGSCEIPPDEEGILSNEKMTIETYA